MNAKQARFAQEFLIDRNSAAAAVRVGYSSKTARQIGHRLLVWVSGNRRIIFRFEGTDVAQVDLVDYH